MAEANTLARSIAHEVGTDAEVLVDLVDGEEHVEWAWTAQRDTIPQ